MKFMSAVKYLAETHFKENDKKDNIYLKICFFKPHPKINGEILDSAIAMGVLSRKDFSNDILSPVEVKDFFSSNTSNFVINFSS